MKNKIKILCLLSILLQGCVKNNMKIGKIYQNESVIIEDLPEIFERQDGCLYMFSGEVEDNLYNCVEINVYCYEENKLVSDIKRKFEINLNSNVFNIILALDTETSVINIFVESNQLYTYGELFRIDNISDEIIFENNKVNNDIYEVVGSNCSNEILLSSLKGVEESIQYEICFALKYEP